MQAFYRGNILKMCLLIRLASEVFNMLGQTQAPTEFIEIYYTLMLLKLCEGFHIFMKHAIIRFKSSPTGHLPYLRGGQAATLAQRWGRIISAQRASPNVTVRLQSMAMKP